MTTEPTQLHSRATADQEENRERLTALFRETPLPVEELLVNLSLYTRASVTAKVLYLDELYREIISMPGVIMEFGTWWGANLVLFESLRAIHEPYNYGRRVIGFDTFEGYSSISDVDGSDALVRDHNYSVSADYLPHLEALLEYHRRENPMGHLPRFELVTGDVTDTLRPYLEEHPETIISLAYLDMQLYEPTKHCLEAITPYLTRGSVIALDELNAPEYPGETVAFRDVFGLDRFELRRSRYLPDRTYMIFDGR
ncbi:MAG: hypothetical protein QOI10_2626 [Solirubrobacterales bacterium]|nr:hypothetical protein [Solirubrobacterales bacterium]